jgi:hypothetical protein
MAFFLQTEKLQQQLLLCLRMLRIFVNAFNGTHHNALRLIEMPYALRAPAGMDDVDILALGDGLVGTGRFTHIAVDA